MGAGHGREGAVDSYAVAWHRAECGNYRADLDTWLDLAGERSKRILDLGCGSGRVAARLADAGHRLTGLDADGVLLSALTASHPEVRAVQADARAFELGASFDLVLAPMQLIQLFLSEEDRRGCLECARRHLAPGGSFAAALVDLEPGALPSDRDLLGDGALTPDRFRMSTGEEALSTPVGFEIDGDDVLHISRRRQILSGDGDCGGGTGSSGGDGEGETGTPNGRVVAEESIRHSLKLLAPATFERELAEAGFGSVTWRRLDATDAHMGSLVAIARAPQ